MLNLLKAHWCCLLSGVVIGWSLQLCPIFHVGHTCPALSDGEKVCKCQTCCTPCDCTEECFDDNCPCCKDHRDI